MASRDAGGNLKAFETATENLQTEAVKMQHLGDARELFCHSKHKARQLVIY